MIWSDETVTKKNKAKSPVRGQQGFQTLDSKTDMEQNSVPYRKLGH